MNLWLVYIVRAVPRLPSGTIRSGRQTTQGESSGINMSLRIASCILQLSSHVFCSDHPICVAEVKPTLAALPLCNHRPSLVGDRDTETEIGKEADKKT